MTGFHTCGAEGRTKDLSIRVRLFVTFEDKDYTTEQFRSVVNEVKQVAEIATAEMVHFIDSLAKKRPIVSLMTADEAKKWAQSFLRLKEALLGGIEK